MFVQRGIVCLVGAIVLSIPLYALSGCSPVSPVEERAPEISSVPTRDAETSPQQPPSAPPEAVVTEESPAEVLSRGVAAWNAWREGKTVGELRITGATLVSATLDAVDLSSVTIDASNFSGAHLAGANFSGAHLTDCNFSDSRAKGGNFTGAIAERLDFSNADLVGVKLNGAQLTEVSFAGADLSETDISEAILAGVDLSNSTLHGISGWQAVKSVQGLNIYRVAMAPSGFKEWAVSHGGQRAAPPE